MGAIPEWVGRRCDDQAAKAHGLAIVQGSDSETAMQCATDAALAEFLCILKERGLRVVPCEPPPDIIVAHTPQLNTRRAREIWRATLESAPPLDVLLGD